jgi:hypothetical protein
MPDPSGDLVPDAVHREGRVPGVLDPVGRRPAKLWCPRRDSNPNLNAGALQSTWGPPVTKLAPGRWRIGAAMRVQVDL